MEVAMELILAGVGALFGILGSLLAFSLSRNIHQSDRRVDLIEAKNAALEHAVVDLRVALADCVKRQTLDEVLGRIGQLDVKVERLLTQGANR